jgi:hypothetical protein
MARAWAILAIPAMLAMASGEIQGQGPPVGIAPSATPSGAPGLPPVPPGPMPYPPGVGPGGFPGLGHGPGAFNPGDPAPVGMSAPSPDAAPRLVPGPGKPIPPDGFSLRPGYSSAFDNCGTCCTPDESRRWVGVGAMMLRPVFQRNPAFGVTFDGEGPKETNLSWGLRGGPWVSTGFQLDNGWGFRGTWWNIAGDSATTVRVNDDPRFVYASAPALGLSWTSPTPSQDRVGAALPDTLRFTSNLNLQALDLDFTRAVDMGPVGGSFNLGVRYSYIWQHFTAERHGEQGAADTSFVYFGHSYWGIGPTASADLFLPICDYIRLYTTGRVTPLFGENRGHSISRDVNRVQDSRFNEFKVIPVGEVESGVDFHMGHGGLRPFLRVAFVGQYWFGAGNATNLDADLVLIGLVASAGLEW